MAARKCREDPVPPRVLLGTGNGVQPPALRTTLTPAKQEMKPIHKPLNEGIVFVTAALTTLSTLRARNALSACLGQDCKIHQHPSRSSPSRMHG